MRIMIAAVGRLKQGPERDLAERYRKRAAATGRSVGLADIDIVEIRESRADNAERRMLEESIAIANVIPEGAVTVILDERGENVSSASFAGHLQGWRAEDRRAVVFIIGARRWPCGRAARQGQARHRVRGRDLAAPVRPHHAAGAALPRGDDPDGPPLSPRLNALLAFTKS